jgi:hypothetical protein
MVGQIVNFGVKMTMVIWRSSLLKLICIVEVGDELRRAQVPEKLDICAFEMQKSKCYAPKHIFATFAILLSIRFYIKKVQNVGLFCRTL